MRTGPNWTTCPHCGEKHDTSGRYTSPTNRERDAIWWRDEQLSGACSPQHDQHQRAERPRTAR